nr:hypothetical protein [Kibdelosporangium sp. MJ126-NF4]CTQ98990.1 hypothetical protein [Kibdelosporangium sp. MJ126-NF4]
MQTGVPGSLVGVVLTMTPPRRVRELGSRSYRHRTDGHRRGGPT